MDILPQIRTFFKKKYKKKYDLTTILAYDTILPFQTVNSNKGIIIDMKENNEKLTVTFKRMFSLKQDTATHEEIRDRLLSGGKFTGTNMCVLICAMLIASVGLNMGSTAVIIGAMLISPLMGSILAMAYGSVANNFGLTKNYAVTFLMQIIISVGISTIYFLLSPVKEATSELMARTSPNFYDVLIATFGGIARCCHCNCIDATSVYLWLFDCRRSLADAWRSCVSVSYQYLFYLSFFRSHSQHTANPQGKGTDGG